MTVTVLPPALTPAPDPADRLAVDVAAALAVLAELGGPDEIAEHMQREYVRGVCGDPGRCAVAAYLDHAVPAVRAAVLYVDSMQWSVFPPGFPDRYLADSDERHGSMPTEVAKFIRRFDAGGYPGLRAADSPPHAPVPF